MTFMSSSSVFTRLISSMGIAFLLGSATVPLQCGHAQVLEQLSDLLQQQKPTPDSSADELPSPQQRPTPQQIDPQTSAEATQRIYLGLEAEELPNAKGLRVATVTRESPAWKAGFQVEDRIMGINGFSINSMNDMVEQFEKVRPGQSVTFLINRAGRTRELTAVLISQAMAEQILNQPGGPQNDTAWIGLSVHDLTPSFREQFGIAAYSGAAVSQVISGSPGHRSGIKAGDAITEIDARPVESAEDFVKWLETALPGDQVSMVIYRGITRKSVQVVLAGQPRPEPTRPTFRPAPPRPRAARPDSQVGDRDSKKVPGVPPQPESGLEPELSDPGVTSRELELQAEVDRLRQELADAQAKLAETKQQLNSILRSLRD